MFVFIFNILDIVSKSLLPHIVWFEPGKTLVEPKYMSILRESVQNALSLVYGELIYIISMRCLGVILLSFVLCVPSYVVEKLV